MRRMALTDVLVGMMLGLGAALAPAQSQVAEPDAAQQEARYAPPPAWKSVEIGNYYLKTRKYTAALSRYEEAVKTDPSYAAAYLGLGRVYEKIGLKQKALVSYQKYLDALPSTKDAEEAKEVHRAITRLEGKLKNRSPAARGKPSGASVAAEPH